MSAAGSHRFRARSRIAKFPEISVSVLKPIEAPEANQQGTFLLRQVLGKMWKWWHTIGRLGCDFRSRNIGHGNIDHILDIKRHAVIWRRAQKRADHIAHTIGTLMVLF
jgi:hypothetical protein